MAYEFNPATQAQLHISFNDVLSSIESEVLEDQLAFVLGALGFKGSIRSDVTWNDTTFPLDYESEDQVNTCIIEEVLQAVCIEANESEGSQPNNKSLFDEEYWRTPDEDENSDDDSPVRDIGDWIREEEESECS